MDSSAADFQSDRILNSLDEAQHQIDQGVVAAGGTTTDTNAKYDNGEDDYSDASESSIAESYQSERPGAVNVFDNMNEVNCFINLDSNRYYNVLPTLYTVARTTTELNLALGVSEPKEGYQNGHDNRMGGNDAGKGRQGQNNGRHGGENRLSKPSFGRQAPRFDPPDSRKTPGPGVYRIEDVKAFDTDLRLKPSTLKGILGGPSERGCETNPTINNPSPGEYLSPTSHPDFLANQIKFHAQHTSNRGVLDSPTSRDTYYGYDLLSPPSGSQASTKSGGADIPGPGTYNTHQVAIGRQVANQFKFSMVLGGSKGALGKPSTFSHHKSAEKQSKEGRMKEALMKEELMKVYPTIGLSGAHRTSSKTVKAIESLQVKSDSDSTKSLMHERTVRRLAHLSLYY